MDQKKIGRFIAANRNKKKLTQVELAERLGVSDRSISKWENGRGLPDVSLFENLCLELDISVNELLKGEQITKETETISNINLIEYSKYLKRKSRNKKILLGVTLLMIILCFSIVVLLSCNRTFFKTKYNSEFLDNVEISIPRFSYYRRTGGQYISVFETLKSSNEVNVFIDTYLSTFEKINCNGEIYYYNRKNDYTIFNYSVNNDGYGFINTIHIHYNNGKSCDI